MFTGRRYWFWTCDIASAHTIFASEAVLRNQWKIGLPCHRVVENLMNLQTATM